MPKRSRNFDGCWTCRSRKVKCDLNKPECKRCQKAGIKCAGYVIKLGWSPPMIVSKDNELILCDAVNLDNKLSSFQRRNVEFVTYPRSQVFRTFSELNTCLEELEDKIKYNHESSYSSGPFHVYRTRDSIKKRRLDIELSNSKNKLSYGETSPQAENHSLIHYDLLGDAKLTIRAIKGLDYNINDQNIFHILYPKYYPNIDSDEWQPESATVLSLFILDKQKNCISITSMCKELLQFFKFIHISFIRVQLRNNYWQTIILPYIEQVVGEFLILNFGEWKDLNPFVHDEPPVEDLLCHVKLILVYLTLCLAAFGKAQLETPEPFLNSENINDFLKLSIMLRKVSITFLNRHLDNYDNNMRDETFRYDEALLLCIILQIQADIYFSVYENFELLFAIGDFILRNRFQEIHQTRVFPRYLVISFTIIKTFFESTHSVESFNYSIEEEDALNYGDLNDDYDLIQSDDDNDDNIAHGYDGKTNVSLNVNKDHNSKPHYTDAKIDEESQLSLKQDLDSSSIESSEEMNSKKSTYSSNSTIEAENISSKSVTNVTSLSNVLVAGERKIPEPFEPDLEVGSIPYKPPRLSPVDFEEEFVYLMAGLPSSLIKLFSKTIHISNHKKMFQTKRVFPRNFPKLCSDLEDSLINWRVKDYWELDNPQIPRTLHIVLYHYILAFHNAILVYFYRIIKSSSKNVYSQYLDLSIFHFNQSLQESQHLVDINFRPSFWVLLIIGSEFNDLKSQNLVQSIWARSQMSSPNNWRAKQVLFETWKRHELGEFVGWLDIVREWEIVLCLV